MGLGVEDVLKVVIVGAGAIGLLIGSYLSELKHEITYITRSPEQAENLTIQGVTRLHATGEEVHTQAVAITDFRLAPKQALWVVAVKTHHLPFIEKELQELPISTPLVFIQNGLAHLQWMERLNQQEMYIATIEHGAMKQNETTVFHRGIGLTKVAPFKTRSQEPIDISPFDTDNFHVELVGDAYMVALRKAVLNACINPITAILQVPNGELVTNPYAFQLLKSLYAELEFAFPEITQLLTFEDVKNLCGNTANNQSSMLQDRQKGRKTEIEPIVGSLLKIADARKLEMPYLRSLYHLVLAIDEKGGKHE